MGNRFHLVLHRRQANLSHLMRHINGVYTQRVNRRRAALLYAKFVSESRGDGTTFWHGALKGQVVLGDDFFVERMQARAEPERVSHKAMPKGQRIRLLA